MPADARRALRRPEARLFCVIAAGLLLAACSKSSRHPVARVEATGPTLHDNALLGLSANEVEQQFVKSLQDSGHFELLPLDSERQKDPNTASLSLELPFTREAQKEGREGRWAEVGATLVIRRRVEGETRRYDVVGLGEVRIQSDADRGRAMKAALSSALTQVTESAHLQLSALRKTDEQLLEDLKAGNSIAQEFALRVLSERQNPAVSEVLISRLTSSDLDQARQAMGVLAEMREQRAVKPLIDLTRGRDPGFVREVLFALAQIGGEEATAYLFTVAQGHDDEAVRSAAQKALDELELRQRVRRSQAPRGGEK